MPSKAMWGCGGEVYLSINRSMKWWRLRASLALILCNFTATKKMRILKILDLACPKFVKYGALYESKANKRFAIMDLVIGYCSIVLATPNMEVPVKHLIGIFYGI